jgi:hypothetical protein
MNKIGSVVYFAEVLGHREYHQTLVRRVNSGAGRAMVLEIS